MYIFVLIFFLRLLIAIIKFGDEMNVDLVTLSFKMFGPFWSPRCKMALAEVGVSLP